MTTRTLRTCIGLLLAALWAGGPGVSVAAQAQAQSKPAATSAQKKPAPDVRSQKKPAPVAAAQQKTAGAASAQPAIAAASPAPPDVERPPAQDAYIYRSEGRRDPFLSLVNRAIAENRPPQRRPEGVRGLSFDEITLRGIFLGRNAPVALVQGPDTKTYQVHVGDRMYDAVVKAITADSLVVLQEVNDPLSLQKQRERRKTLRVAEEVK
jgi:Tfp pilus assembly protein PilP